VARASSAGARRALVACETWRGSALARVRRQAGRAESRVSRAQERELERSTVEAARRLGSGTGSGAGEPEAERCRSRTRERLRSELMRRDAGEHWRQASTRARATWFRRCRSSCAGEPVQVLERQECERHRASGASVRAVACGRWWCGQLLSGRSRAGLWA
jgi:hypothetical protein